MTYIIRSDNKTQPLYFREKCGPNCVSFVGRADSPLAKRFDTEQEALDEIDWLPEKAGPYVVEHYQSEGE